MYQFQFVVVLYMCHVMIYVVFVVVQFVYLYVVVGFVLVDCCVVVQCQVYCFHYTLYCTKCNCKIVQSTNTITNNNNQYYTDIYIHNNANDNNTNDIGNTYTTDDYIIVTDQFQFDNVGVSRNVPIQQNDTNTTTNDTTSHGEYKYLVCADCDYGPIGITYIQQPSVFYVVTSKCKKVDT